MRSTVLIPTCAAPAAARHRLRARYWRQPNGEHRHRQPARRCAHSIATATRLAAPLGRTGAKGQHWYSWTLVDITNSGDGDDGAGAGHHHLLVRRNDKTGELAYYRCYIPTPATLGDYVRVAAWRWKVEENFQAGKEPAGLDEHQVRRWTSWHRWVTLAMLAHAFLAVTAAA
jgi:SRSO17 transposase